MIWEQAQECPCRRRAEDFSGNRFTSTHLVSDNPGTTTEARPDCELCKGGGYFYHSPQEIRGLVTRASATPEAYTAWGAYTRGMVFFTLLPEHLPGLFDRCTMVDSAMLFRESRVRIGTNVEKLRYPIVTRQLDLSTGPTSVNVLHFQASSGTGLTDTTHTLVQGTNFDVTVDGELNFDFPGAPAEGTRYSVSYYTKPRYVVVDHPHTNRDSFIKTKTPNLTFTPLPVQCMGRLDFLGDAQ